MGCYTHCNRRLRYTLEQLQAFATTEAQHRQAHHSQYTTWLQDGEKLIAGDKETYRELVEAYLNRVHSPTGSPRSSGDGEYLVSRRNDLAYRTEFCGFMRIRRYTDQELHSLQETLDYMAQMQRAEVHIEEGSHTMPELEKFWRENPTGMIAFW